MTKRTEIRDQDTFRYTTPSMKPAVNPTDPFVRPEQAQKSNSLSHLMDSLGVLAQLHKERQAETKREQEELGVGDVMRGMQEAGGNHPERIKAFETFKGEAAAGDYHAKLSQYVEENKHLLPDEFDSGLAQLRDEMIVGRSNNFMVGLAKRALSLEESARVANRSFLSDTTQQEFMHNLGKALDMDLAPGVSRTPQDMRTLLTTYQDKAGSFAKKAQVTELFVNKAIALADERGDASLLAFTNIADASGYSPIADPRLQQKIVNGVQAAERSKERTENRLIQDQKDKEKEAKRLVSNEIASSLFSLQPGTPQFREHLDKTIGILEAQKATMDDGDFRVLRQLAYDIQQGGGFRKTPDFDKYHEAHDLARRGELQDITPFLPYLDKGSYDNLRMVQDRAKDQMNDQRYSRSVKNTDAFLNLGREKVAGEKDFTGNYPEGYVERQRTFDFLFRTKYEELHDIAVETSNGVIPVKELERIQTESINMTLEQHKFNPAATQGPSGSKKKEAEVKKNEVSEKLRSMKKPRVETAGDPYLDSLK